jgi:hypothetical protein
MVLGVDDRQYSTIGMKRFCFLLFFISSQAQNQKTEDSTPSTDLKESTKV